MPVSRAIQSVTRGLERHADRLGRIQERRLDLELGKMKFEREEQRYAEQKELRDIQKKTAIVNLAETQRKIDERNKIDAQPATLNLGKSNSILDAKWKADRLLDNNKALTQEFGEPITYDPNTKRFLRSAVTDMETGEMSGIALTNRELRPHAKNLYAAAGLNASLKRYLEAQLEDPNADPRFKARLNKYNDNPIKELEGELERKNAVFSQFADQFKNNPVLLAQAEAGIAATQADLTAAREAKTEKDKEVAKERERIRIREEKREFEAERFTKRETQKSIRKRIDNAQKEIDSGVMPDPVFPKDKIAMTDEYRAEKQAIIDEANRQLGGEATKAVTIKPPEGAIEISISKDDPKKWNETIKTEKAKGRSVVQGRDGKIYSIPDEETKEEPKKKKKSKLHIIPKRFRRKKMGTSAYNVVGYDKDGTLWVSDPKTGKSGTYINNEFTPKTAPRELFKESPKG